MPDLCVRLEEVSNDRLSCVPPSLLPDMSPFRAFCLRVTPDRTHHRQLYRMKIERRKDSNVEQNGNRQGHLRL